MAEKYKPKPKIKCVCKLRNRAKFGLGVFAAAIPKPMQGCIRKKGNPTVNAPKAIEIIRLGSLSQSLPVKIISVIENIIPVR